LGVEDLALLLSTKRFPADSAGGGLSGFDGRGKIKAERKSNISSLKASGVESSVGAKIGDAGEGGSVVFAPRGDEGHFSSTKGSAEGSSAV